MKSSKTTAPGRKVAAGSRTPKKPTRSATPRTDLRLRIEQRAYELWEFEGRPGGRDQAHWFQAERELTGSTAANPAR